MVRMLMLVAIALSWMSHARAQDGGADANLVPPAPLNERVLTLPGDPLRPVSLEVTLFMPAGPGPFPLAVMNHGATNISANNRGPRYRYTYSAYYFLSRGYAVAMPMARGFAGSGGSLVHDGCDLGEIGMANARDIRAVIAEVGRQPGIDASRIVVAGQSFGGWTTLALGTLAVPGVHGLIAFSPALRASDCPAQDHAMVEAAAGFGAQARLPSLWFFGDNDSIMPTAEWHAVFDAYTRAGGRAGLVSIGRFMQDSHQMLSAPESLPIWTPRVDAFLARIGLPAAELYPDYLPMPFPPPTHANPVDDVASVPFLNDPGRDAYRKFLTRPFPRAFAIGPQESTSFADGGFDPLARSLAACRKAGVTCRLYAVDGDVVWTGGSFGPAVYTSNLAANSTAMLDFSYSVNRDCSVRGLPKLSVSQPPAHGVAAILPAEQRPRFPAGNPYAACNAVPVAGVAVTYTPTPGFTGQDAMVFEETDAEGGHRVYRMSLTVK